MAKDTAIRKVLETRGLSMYRLIVLLGYDPRSRFDNWSKKLDGEMAMTMEEVSTMCEKIEKYTGKSLSPSDLKMEPAKVFMK